MYIYSWSILHFVFKTHTGQQVYSMFDFMKFIYFWFEKVFYLNKQDSMLQFKNLKFPVTGLVFNEKVIKLLNVRFWQRENFICPKSNYSLKLSVWQLQNGL